MNIASLSLEQLKRAVQIREQLDSLQHELSKILGGGGQAVASSFAAKGRKGMSAAGRARIAAAQKARWAKMKSGKAQKPVGRRVMSAAAKAKIAAAARARWARVKAAGKKRL